MNKEQKIIKDQLINSFCYYKGEIPDCYSSFWDNISKNMLNQIIPEVLKSVVPEKILPSNYDFHDGSNSTIDEIKQKAKELYGIDL